MINTFSKNCSTLYNSVIDKIVIRVAKLLRAIDFLEKMVYNNSVLRTIPRFMRWMCNPPTASRRGIFLLTYFLPFKTRTFFFFLYITEGFLKQSFFIAVTFSFDKRWPLSINLAPTLILLPSLSIISTKGLYLEVVFFKAFPLFEYNFTIAQSFFLLLSTKATLR